MKTLVNKPNEKMRWRGYGKDMARMDYKIKGWNYSKKKAQKRAQKTERRTERKNVQGSSVESR